MFPGILVFFPLTFYFDKTTKRAWIIVVLFPNASEHIATVQLQTLCCGFYLSLFCPPTCWFCPQSQTAELHVWTDPKHNSNTGVNRTTFRFLMCFSMMMLELTQLWSKRTQPGFSKLSVYTSVMEGRKRKFTVLVDMHTHRWLRNKKKRLPLLFSEQTRINSKHDVNYILSIIN